MNINEIVKTVSKNSGVKLEACEDFAGVRDMNGDKYINVTVEGKLSETRDYDLLSEYANISKLIKKIEYNGVRRVALFLR